MEKLAIIKSDKMGDYEKEQGFASYKTMVEWWIGDIVLCNNIVDIDSSVYDNMDGGLNYYNTETGEDATEEDYNNDNDGSISFTYPDIYQWFLCNVSNYEKEQAKKAGLILSYSDMLDCDVLCVDHFGTSWDYVLTDCKIVENYEELEKLNKEDQE